MIAGPLFAVGLGCFFAGLHRALTGRDRFETRKDWALSALGAAMTAGACALWKAGLA